MTEPGTIALVTRDNQAWVVMSGEIDFHTTTAFTDDYLNGNLPHGEQVHVDMAQVVFLDSQGLGLLIRLHNRYGVALHGVPDRVLKLLHITGLAEMFDIVDHG